MIRADVVPRDVPFLIGLDTLDKFQLNIDVVHHRLHAPKAGWDIPTNRKNGHIYLEWRVEDRTLLSRPKLQTLYVALKAT